VVVEWATRRVKSRDHFGEILAAHDPASRSVNENCILYTFVGGHCSGGLMAIPSLFEPVRQLRPNGGFLPILCGCGCFDLIGIRLPMRGPDDCK
jgi:hypothetical protein